MKIEKIRAIANSIMNYCEKSSIMLADYIINYINANDYELSEEELIESLGDEKSNDFMKLVRELEKQIDKATNTSRINLIEDFEGYHIKTTDFGAQTKVIVTKKIWDAFDSISGLNKTQRGSIYEEFCSKFLNDIGLEAKVTPQSNDKGIDIFAKYDANLKGELASLVFNDSVYLLGQAKFFKKSIDTPVIRKLVGDTFFLRFDKLEYVDIAHNAIHLVVFSHSGYTQGAIDFAKSNKIMLLDSMKIVNIVAASKNPNNWSCYKYLLQQAI